MSTYEFLEKLMPTEWISAALVVIFIIILEYKEMGNPWTRALMGILAALAIKGFLIYNFTNQYPAIHHQYVSHMYHPRRFSNLPS